MFEGGREEREGDEARGRGCKWQTAPRGIGRAGITDRIFNLRI